MSLRVFTEGSLCVDNEKRVSKGESLFMYFTVSLVGRAKRENALN